MSLGWIWYEYEGECWPPRLKVSRYENEMNLSRECAVVISVGTSVGSVVVHATWRKHKRGSFVNRPSYVLHTRRDINIGVWTASKDQNPNPPDLDIPFKSKSDVRIRMEGQKDCFRVYIKGSKLRTSAIWFSTVGTLNKTRPSLQCLF